MTAHSVLFRTQGNSLPTPHRSHSLLNLIVHLANSNHREAHEIALALSNEENPYVPPLLRGYESELGSNEILFELL